MQNRYLKLAYDDATYRVIILTVNVLTNKQTNTRLTASRTTCVSRH